jgi:hypothetical protein
MAQSHERLFDDVVAKSCANHKSHKIERSFTQCGNSCWATDKIGAKKELLP